MKKILVAVAWPYVNGPMHVGHLAGAYLAPDLFARYHRLKGNDVLMVSGSDMHGTPTAVLAEQEGVEPIEVAERYHARMSNTLASIDISFDLYTKTSTQNHIKTTQDVFVRLLEKGYIFKDFGMQMYCEQDKRFLPDRFVEGTCPYCANQKARGDQCDKCGRTLDAKDLIDPRCKMCGRTPIEKETEHFFLDLPAFSEKLDTYIHEHENHWKNNVTNFSLGWLKEGLKPRAITRDMNYGIPVPVEGYEGKVIYVWFEAVIGYLSASKEWAELQGTPDAWKEFWINENAYHYYFMGKDNIPFHTIVWPAELMGYDHSYNLPYNVLANENLQIEGEKFSKSTGNYIEADYLIENYGSDQVRYYIISTMPETSDADFTWKGFIDAINNELVANFGNLVNRTLIFTQKNFEGVVPIGTLDEIVAEEITKTFELIDQYLGDGLTYTPSIPDEGIKQQKVSFSAALHSMMKLSRFGNKYFDEHKPWAEKETAAHTMYNMIQILSALETLSRIFLPKTATKLQTLLGVEEQHMHPRWRLHEIVAGTLLTNPGLLFAKIDVEQIEKEKEIFENNKKKIS